MTSKGEAANDQMSRCVKLKVERNQGENIHQDDSIKPRKGREEQQGWNEKDEGVGKEEGACAIGEDGLEGHTRPAISLRVLAPMNGL